MVEQKDINNKQKDLDFLLSQLGELVRKENFSVEGNISEEIISKLPTETENSTNDELLIDPNKSYKIMILDFFRYIFAPATLCIIFLGLTMRVLQKNSPEITIVLETYQPSAGKVEIIGDFNNWQPARLKKSNGYWRIKLDLKPGRYKYVYIIDNKTLLIDPNSEVYEDVYGNKNSVLYI